MTIDDLRSATLKSGFRNVALQHDKRTKAFHAQVMDAFGKRRNWYGPWRDTGEEAAQDYLDYLAGQPPLTIEDIRNPKRRSGFDHVRFNSHDGHARKPYQANGGGRGTATGNPGGPAWFGSRRAAAEEAAQDYCDYVNAQRPQQPVPSMALRTAGHVYDIEKSERGPEVEAALGVLRDYKAQRDGRQGYVYLISDGTAYKVGYSVNPNKRVAELQTGNPRKLSLLASIPGTEADEKALHQKYISDNLLQEWFAASPELRSEFIKEVA